jgi:Rnl2 family RNA ligase
MSFTKFGSIKNSYDNKTTNSILKYTPDKTVWCIQEKVHGANLSIGKDINGVWVAKRSDRLSKGASFYGWENNYERWSVSYNKLVSELVEQKIVIPDDNVIVRGEIFGGLYPDMPSLVKHVQRGVYYCNDIQFIVFDIQVNDTYVDIDVAMSMARIAGFDVLGIKKTFKSLSEAIAYNCESTRSSIYKLYNMPELDVNLYPNIIEGIVIKPIKAFKTCHGSRACLKKKTSAFCEIVNIKNKKVILPVLNEYIDISEYMTIERYNSAISKIGRENATIQSVGKEIIRDVTVDYIEDHLDVNRELLNKSITKVSYIFAKKELTNDI